MFRKANKEELDWNEFHIQCQRFRLSNFVSAMDNLADMILGLKNYDDLGDLEKRIWIDAFRKVTLADSKMKQRFIKAFGILQSSWKFKYYGHSSMIRELSTTFFAYLFVDNPELT